MINDSYKSKVKNLVAKAKEKGAIKTYKQFCETEFAQINRLSEDEVKYYTYDTKDEFDRRFNIGDIVFVANYEYKSGNNGQNHSFVIIDKEQAVDINYFGFLLYSNMDKLTYPYNEVLYKDEKNKLRKDGIVKCDDLIELKDTDIKFKIGEVSQEDLERFIDTYDRYLNNI